MIDFTLTCEGETHTFGINNAFGINITLTPKLADEVSADYICDLCDWFVENQDGLINMLYFDDSCDWLPIPELCELLDDPFVEKRRGKRIRRQIYLRQNPPPKPDKKTRRPGYIYLMKAENGYYKIGRSKDVPARLKQLNREFPIKIEVVHQFWATDYISREKDLHFLFKDQQQEGEWFALDQGDIETIMELKDEEPEPTS